MTTLAFQKKKWLVSRRLIEFFDLLNIQLKRVRNLGIVFLVMSIILPSGFLISLKFITGHTTPERALYIVVGNIILSIINICLVSLGQNITFMKRIKTLQYFAIMPISKINVILSIVFSFFLISIPGIFVVLIIGSFLFKFSITFSPLLIPAIIIIGLSFAGVGSIIGIKSNEPMKAGLFCQFIMFLIIFISPLFVSIDALPKALQVLAYTFPSTYGVNLLRAILTGSMDNILLNFVVLAGYSLVGMLLFMRYFEWGELD